MPALAANNAASKLSAAITSGATTLSIEAPDASKFPSPGAGDWFPMTLVDNVGNMEIVKVTARAGSVCTVTRGAEGTLARAFPLGSKADLRITAALLANKASLEAVAQKADKTELVPKANTADVDATYFKKAGGVIAGNVVVEGLLRSKASTGNTYQELLRSDGSVASRFYWLSASNDTAIYAYNADGSVAMTLVMDTSANTLLFNNVAVATTADLAGYLAKTGGSLSGALAVDAYITSTGTGAGLRTQNRTSIDKWTIYSTSGILCFNWDAAQSGTGGNKMSLNYSTADLTVSGNVTAFSDPRLKDDIAPIDNPLSILAQLDGVRFKWNDKNPDLPRIGEWDVGLLADQVEAVLPELISQSEQDSNGNVWKTVAYPKLVAVLLEGIKVLDERVRKLEAR